MILRPAHLEIVNCEILFNLHLFEILEIDLAHINKDGRANYKIRVVIKIVGSLLSNLSLKPVATKSYGDEHCFYYVRIGMYNLKKYKIVFCLCSDKPLSIGIITLYRVKG